MGVSSKGSCSQKVIGPVINYSTGKGLIRVKFFLDYESRTLRVFTQSNPKGEVYTDLPEGELYPAAQNMTMRSLSTCLKVAFVFD